MPPTLPPQENFNYIPGSEPFALGPFEHLFAGPGCAYETLNPTELISKIEHLREAGHRPAINSVPNVACVRAFLYLQEGPAPVSTTLFAVKQAMMAGVTTRSGLDALFAGFESWGGEMCAFRARLCEFLGLQDRGGMQVFTFEKTAVQEPGGFTEAMIATFSGPSPLIEWLGANMSDADRQDVTDNGM